MIININKKMPSFLDFEYFLFDGFDNLKELYSQLSVKDEILLATPENIKKIVDHVNGNQEDTNFHKELLNISGLNDYSEITDVYIRDYKMNNQYIAYIFISECHKINHEGLSNFISRSKQELFDYIRNSEVSESISHYSLRKPEYIEICDLTFKKDTFNLGLKLDYLVEADDYSMNHFDIYRKGKYRFEATRTTNGSVHITINKNYSMKLEKGDGQI